MFLGFFLKFPRTFEKIIEVFIPRVFYMMGEYISNDNKTIDMDVDHEL